MKYKIYYTQGNGYSCSCCRSWSDEIESVADYEQALHLAAEIMAENSISERHFDDIEAVAESQHDFINVNGKSHLNFDKEVFLNTARKLINQKILEKAKQDKEEKEKYELERKLAEEARDKKEYLRLKNKYKNMKNIDQRTISLILNYIIQPNTPIEDDVAEFIETNTNGEITADDFHEWIAKFDVETI